MFLQENSHKALVYLNLTCHLNHHPLLLPHPLGLLFSSSRCSPFIYLIGLKSTIMLYVYSKISSQFISFPVVFSQSILKFIVFFPLNSTSLHKNSALLKRTSPKQSARNLKFLSKLLSRNRCSLTQSTQPFRLST